MRYLFKTDYRQDMTLWRHRGDLFWYGLLGIVLLAIPFMMGEFYVGELGGVFIFAIAGVGMMLLAGYTGLISLGNAAFLGIGAYTNSVLLAHGVPFLITLPAAGLFTALFGAAIGLPTLRMSGLYLAIATLAFGSIVGTVFQKWDAVTGGFDGFAVPTPYIFGMPIEQGRSLIDQLIAHASQRQFVYTHRWRLHDLVMWDDRCTMHRGTDFEDLRWTRDMQRATVSDIANTCEQEGVTVAAA
jgi:ABC-type branched-subunit amino acid transport system permease subunit